VEIFLLLPEGDLNVVLVLYGSHVVIVGIGGRLTKKNKSKVKQQGSFHIVSFIPNHGIHGTEGTVPYLPHNLKKLTIGTLHIRLKHVVPSKRVMSSLVGNVVQGA